MNFPSTFRDVQRVGSGGLGDVYFARRVSSDTDVAIKVLRQKHGQEAVLRRANREREALTSLRGHPNVVHLEEVAESSEGEILLVMEYMPVARSTPSPSTTERCVSTRCYSWARARRTRRRRRTAGGSCIAISSRRTCSSTGCAT